MLDLTRLIGADLATALGTAEPAVNAPVQTLDASEGVPFNLAQWLEPLPQVLDEVTSEVELGLPVMLAEQSSASLPDASGELAEAWLQGMLGQQQLHVRADDDPAPVALPEAAMMRAWAGFSQPLNRPVPEPVQAERTRAALAMPVSLSPTAAAPIELAPVLSAGPVKTAPLIQAPMSAVAELPAALAATLSANSAEAAPVGALFNELTAASPVRATAPLASASEHSLAQQLQQVVRNSVELQLRQNIQSATIRLDPPELGSLEIFVSHEAGRVSVSIQASNLDVSRLLGQTSDRLRQDLVAANYLHVNVQVGSDTQQGRQQQGRQAPYPQAMDVLNAQVFDEPQGSERTASDVLVTV